MKLMNLELVGSAESLDSEKIRSIISEHSCIADYFFTFHENEVTSNGVRKYSHYHIYLRFKSPQNPENVCEWFGVPRTFWYRFHGSIDDFKDIMGIVKGVKI